MNPRKKPYVTEMMNVTEYIKVERGPPCSIAQVESSGDIVATFRTSTVWKIDEKVLQGLVSGISVSAEGLKHEKEDMD